MSKIVKVHSAAHVHISAEVSLRVRRNFALSHLSAATSFTLQIEELERINVGKTFGPFFDEIQRYVSAAVIMSAAAIEANLNEVAEDKRVDQEFMNEIDRLPALKRHQAFLEHLGKPKLNAGAEPCQSVQALIQFRNELLHFRPEWADNETGRHRRLGKQLSKVGFRMSPFLPDTEQVFPMRCMSHGCGEWAVKKSLQFIREFRERVGANNEAWERSFPTSIA